MQVSNNLRFLIFIVLFCIVHFTVNAQYTDDNANLSIDKKDDKYGYLNKKTKAVVIPHQFDEAKTFYEGLALVKKDGKEYVINPKGETVIPPNESLIYHFDRFVNGLLRIQNKADNKLGFIDKTGRIIIEPTYLGVENFWDSGLALAYTKPMIPDGYIDKTGTLVIKNEYDHLYDFTEGMAMVMLDGKYGFINTKGELAIPTIYTFENDVSNFSNGFASFKNDDGACGYINKKGEVVIEPQYKYCNRFENGEAAVVDFDDKRIAINAANITVKDIDKEFADKVRKDSLKVAQHLGCIEGDCENGFGTYNYLDTSDEDLIYSYKGFFKDGKYDGPGLIKSYGYRFKILIPDEGGFKPENYEPTIVANFKEGKIDTNTIAIYRNKLIKTFNQFYDNYDHFKNIKPLNDPNGDLSIYAFYHDTVEKEDYSVNRYSFFIYNTFSDGTSFKILSPFNRAFGKCIEGGCGKNAVGRAKEWGRLDLGEMGILEGDFRADGSMYSGVLTIKSGDKIAFSFRNSIPNQVATVGVAPGKSWLKHAKDAALVMIVNNICLEGDCGKDGYGTSSLITELGSSKRRNAEAIGYYKGKHRSFFCPVDSSGVYEPYTKYYYIENPVFNLNGQLDGEFDIRSTSPLSRGETEKALYKNDIRMTLDGKHDYFQYERDQLKKRIAASEAKMERLEEERRARVRARLEAEARAKQQYVSTYQKPKRSTQSRSTFCRMCKGSGSYWDEWYEKKCTKTIDYTYSSGKYSQTSMDCIDVKRGGYVKCNVCGGDGRK